MSRIGRQPIPVDAAVKVKIDGSTVTIQGPKGTISRSVPEGISVSFEDATIQVARSDDSKPQKSLHGLTRALLANAVAGVHQGFSKDLEIHGVGYRAEVKGKNVNLALGYSHPVIFPIPEGIEIKVDKNTRLSVSGCDRQQVGQVAADLRKLRPPDVYKLKGVRYQGEQLRKKASKAGA